MRERVRNWWALQRLSWKALRTSPQVMARSLQEAALEKKFKDIVPSDDLMRQAFQDKLAGKTNEQSFAMRELIRRSKVQ